MDAVRRIAPAKINLFLHITGKRADGYHLLQSLVAFTDFGDQLTIKNADQYSLVITGNNNLPATQENLVSRAIHATAAALKRPPNVAVTLDKHIPLGAGLGGGSSDAATAIKALLNLWDEKLTQETLQKIFLGLGADVPVCYHGAAATMEGIGDLVTPLDDFIPMPAIIAYPNVHCSTADIFKKIAPPYSHNVVVFPDINFISAQKNDLTGAAISEASEIKNVLEIIKDQDGCKLSRMSGSGSACFGLFDNTTQSEFAAQRIQKACPDWWVRSALLK